MTLEDLTRNLEQKYAMDEDEVHTVLGLSSYGFSEGSIYLLLDKGFGEKALDKRNKTKNDFSRMIETLEDETLTFSQRRESRTSDWKEEWLDKGDALEITDGRYKRMVQKFKDISSEQALVKKRLKFGVEYIISFAKKLQTIPNQKIANRAFSDEEENKLREIHTNFKTSDYLAVKLIEERTNHDIVAANTWLTIQAQRAGVDDQLVRKLVHFGRTSADVNTNVTGELYTMAFGEWTKSLSKLLGTLEEKSRKYTHMTCLSETHGQVAQFTTLGHIYANLAQQIRDHAKPFLGDKRLVLDGKIAGAIGTDADILGAFPTEDFSEMYKGIVEDKFGLKIVELGNDQDCSNAELARALDCMVNVGMVVQKAANDTWIYCQRHILSKQTTKGESGSSAMPQKANPFLAEGCEAMMEIVANAVTPIKKMIIAYREQGDLRRSITKREGFHPIMQSIIGIERLNIELNQYEPDVVGMESEIVNWGVGASASVLQTYLKKEGVPDAYDRIKDLTMKSRVSQQEIEVYISALVQEGTINQEAGDTINGMLASITGSRDVLEKFYENPSEDTMERVTAVNTNSNSRSRLLGSAVNQTNKIVFGVHDTKEKLERYQMVD